MDAEKRRGRSLSDFHMALYRAFHAQRAYLRPRISCLGMGPGQPKLVTYIAVHGPSTQRQIADFFETDPATVSRMLDALERSGFLVSEPGEDRRTKRLRLTERGLAVADAWDACCDEEQEAMLDGFSAEERAAFADYLARAHANLRRAAEEGGSRG